MTRFERIASGILSIATWPVLAVFALVAIRHEAASIMRFVRDPWNPEVPFMAKVLMHGGPVAVALVGVVLGGILRMVHGKK